MLRNYCKVNPAVGYCQGMNTIAAAVLLALKSGSDSVDNSSGSVVEVEIEGIDEWTAFWIFVSVIERNRGYYIQNMCGLVVDQAVLADMMVSWCPDVLQHLNKFDIQVAAVTAPWFICLFVQSPLCLEDAWQIWDLYFEHGPVILFETAICIFQLMEKILHKLKSQEETLLLLLQKLGKKLDVRSVPGMVVEMHEKFGKGLTLQVAHLREFHRVEIMNSQISGDGYIKLALGRTAISMGHSSEKVMDLWRCFHEPNPWEILESGVIQDSETFRRAISQLCWSDFHRRRWKSSQGMEFIFSRIFDVMTRHSQGQLGFVEFIKVISSFQNEDWKSRLPLAFACCDVDGDGILSPADAVHAIGQLTVLYTGKSLDEVEDEVDRSVSELLWSPNGSHEGSPLSAFQLFCQNGPEVEVIRDFFMLEDSNLFKRFHTRSKSIINRLSL
eukprot:TRINITY_DN5046_c0_g1_i1.p1 TRINITY_DN5046_c0_g1~~TRINITY_DN5046_c0_g1_i1.p1  ORF type:complete len:442 (+),score=94.64 TRINITY_DN5046_c0_g1_i1:758-2083(+)